MLVNKKIRILTEPKRAEYKNNYCKLHFIRFAHSVKVKFSARNLFWSVQTQRKMILLLKNVAEFIFSLMITDSWGLASSFKFCFDGVEKNSIGAIGMVGSKKDNHFGFMSRYNEMIKRINPRAVICFGEPFAEMSGNIIKVTNHSSRKAVS